MNILIIVITMILRWCSIFCIDKSGVICLLKRYCNNRRTLCTMIRLGFTLKYSFTQWLAFSALLAAISSRCKLVHRKVLLLWRKNLTWTILDKILYFPCNTNACLFTKFYIHSLSKSTFIHSKFGVGSLGIYKITTI